MRVVQALSIAAVATLFSWAAVAGAAAPAEPGAALFNRLYLCHSEAYPLRHFVLQVDDSARRMRMLTVRERDETPAGLGALKLDADKQSWPSGATAVLVIDKARFACEATHDD